MRAILILLAVSAAACGTAARESSSGPVSAALCEPGACGPALGMPNWTCPDGSLGGPTGRCLRLEDGRCGWEVRQCDVPCQGLAGQSCPAGQVCVAKPGSPCSFPDDPDCGGVCVAPVSCGGFPGFPCPEGQACVDDPRDGCQPRHGAADCGGLCAPK